VDTGVLCLEPASGPATCRARKDIVLSCGIHGNETAPIEICNQLLTRLLSGELKVRHRVLFLFGNPAAMNLGVREVEENMNRLFSGAHSKGGAVQPGAHPRHASRAVCEPLLRRPGQARYHYDLHTAIRGSRHEKFAVYPFPHERPHCKEQVQFPRCLRRAHHTALERPHHHLQLLQLAPPRRSRLYGGAGQGAPFGENDMTRFIEVRQTLQELVTRDEVVLEPWRADDFTLFAIDRVINKQSEQFRFLFASDVDNFTEFPQGFVLAEDGDRQYRVEKPREAVVFPTPTWPSDSVPCCWWYPPVCGSELTPFCHADPAPRAVASSMAVMGMIPNSI
jgi:succinylglutamate desuccinylase